MRASLTAPGIPSYPQDDETAITGDFTASRTAAMDGDGWGCREPAARQPRRRAVVFGQGGSPWRGLQRR
eukprot:1568587-Prymnesium_polylepis.1